ncbi:MAG: glycosyltransferase family 2 protein [Clostridiaceae bacterium]|nr:glycosyltransferase family 2 protein [Clostridiaceae bacterium]
MTDLSIAIVTYNNERTIGAALDSLLSHLPPDLTCRIILVDNGSADRTLEIAGGYAGQITIVKSERGNIGFGAAHNLLLSKLDSRCHLIMNPDIHLQSVSALSNLVRYLDQHEDVGMVVPQVLSLNGERQFLCRQDPTVMDLMVRFFPGHLMAERQKRHTMQDHSYTRPFDVPFASGCFIMIRTALFQKLGGFDERFFLYLEDADLSRRVRREARVVYVPDAVVVHEWERSSYKNLRQTRVHIQSFYRYFRKWGWKWL